MNNADSTHLTVERKAQRNGTPEFGQVMMTPMIGSDYWSHRVILSDKQALLAFPKFTTFGIGFANEEDWNTNLPYTCATREIAAHIAHNKGDTAIADADVLRGIAMLQQAVVDDKAAGLI